MFGGEGSGGPLGDTWIWNGDSWQQQHPATSPSARAGALMAFDPRSRRLVLVGDSNFFPGGVTDTWSWDGSTWHQEVAPSDLRSPVARGTADMAEDPATGQLILVTATPPMPGAPGVPDPSSADPATDGVIMSPAPIPPPSGGAVPIPPRAGSPGDSGGVPPLPTPIDLGSVASDQRQTWAWSGSAWMRLSPDTSPTGALGATGLAYDGSAHRLVLMTTTGPSSCRSAGPGIAATPNAVPATPRAQPMPGIGCTWTPQQHRWSWDGHTWTDDTTTPAYLPPTALVSMPDDSGLLLANHGSTWTARGTAWTHRQPTAELFARTDFSMASDPAHNTVVLFGGRVVSTMAADTWTWNGTIWTHRAGTAPPAPTFRAPPPMGAAPTTTTLEVTPCNLATPSPDGVVACAIP
jgi:hypothetical protein